MYIALFLYITTLLLSYHYKNFMKFKKNILYCYNIITYHILQSLILYNIILLYYNSVVTQIH